MFAGSVKPWHLLCLAVVIVVVLAITRVLVRRNGSRTSGQYPPPGGQVPPGQYSPPPNERRPPPESP